MTDKIVYLVTSHDVDGRGPERIEYASYSKTERNAWHEKSRNKNYYSLTQRIVDMDQQFRASSAKLDALDRLVLGLDTTKKG